MATQTLNSTAEICSLLQRSYETVTDAARVLAIEPAMVIDRKAFYTAEQVERIAAELRNEGKAS